MFRPRVSTAGGKGQLALQTDERALKVSCGSASALHLDPNSVLAIVAKGERATGSVEPPTAREPGRQRSRPPARPRTSELRGRGGDRRQRLSWRAARGACRRRSASRARLRARSAGWCSGRSACSAIHPEGDEPVGLRVLVLLDGVPDVRAARRAGDGGDRPAGPAADLMAENAAEDTAGDGARGPSPCLLPRRSGSTGPVRNRCRASARRPPNAAPSVITAMTIELTSRSG